MASVQISTGLARSLLGAGTYAGSFESIFGQPNTVAGDEGVIRIYGYQTPAAGIVYGQMTPPTTADEALTIGVAFGGAELLQVVAEIKSDDALDEMHFDTATTSNFIDKITDTWSGVVATPPGGTPAYVWVPVFWRLTRVTDNNSTVGTSFPRVQGDINQDLTGAGVLSSTTLVAAASQTIDVFRFAIPLTTV